MTIPYANVNALLAEVNTDPFCFCFRHTVSSDHVLESQCV